MPEDRVLSFLILLISQDPSNGIHFGKLTQRKVDAKICALRRLNGVLFTVIYFSWKKKKDDTEKRGWKTETCKIDAWDEVFEINCATFRISTQREREWGKYWMCTDSFEHLKCCLLFSQQFLFDSIEKRKQKKN